MKISKKTMIGVGIAIVIIIIIIVAILLSNKDIKMKFMGENILPSNIRFKEEYENLNDKTTSEGTEYISVDISEENPIIYKSDSEILEVLNKERGIVFFGSETDNESRAIVESLLKIAKDNNIEKVYYVNIGNIRDKYVVKEGKIEQEIKGTESYYKILDFLGNKLDAYYVKDSEGKEYATNETRLEPATIVAVSDGEVKAFHEGTVISHKDNNSKLTADEEQEILNIYQNLYEPINDNLCPSTGC